MEKGNFDGMDLKERILEIYKENKYKMNGKFKNG